MRNPLKLLRFCFFLLTIVPHVRFALGIEYLYVADYGSSSLYRVPISGASQSTAQKMSIPGLNQPDALVIDSSGNLFVSNWGTNSILKISPTGNATTFASSVGRIRGMTFDNAGNLYASSGNTILKFTPSGTKSTYFSTSLSSPWGITMDSSNNLFGVNFSNSTLFEITSTGSYLSTSLYNNNISYTSTPSNPTGIIAAKTGGFYITFATPSSGLLYMASLNYRDTRDVTISSYASTSIEGLAYDSSGALFIAGGNSDGIVTKYGSGAYVSGLNTPSGLAVGPYIVAEPNSLISTIFSGFLLIILIIRHNCSPLQTYLSRPIRIGLVPDWFKETRTMQEK